MSHHRGFLRFTNIVFTSTVVGCSSYSATTVLAPDAGAGTGGTSSVAGASAGGDKPGGASSVGGTSPNAGASSVVAGTNSVGGITGVGGTTSSAGAAGSSTVLITGGTSSVGGAFTGGNTGSGGSSTTIGGATSTGGTVGTPTSSNSGGTTPIGGASTGGKAATGGSSEITTGGSPGTGGRSATGGTPAKLVASSISAGTAHSCAVLAGGQVRCWGYNFYGQLGNNGTTDSHVPAVVSPSSTGTVISARSLSLSNSFSCALLTERTVYCWGANDTTQYSGQFGNNSTIGSPIPVQGSSLTQVTAISTGSQHSCLLTSLGSVVCSGDNYVGELGNGATVNSLTPTNVTGIASAISIGSGDNHSCAVLADGTAHCWGANDKGQLGNGTTINSTTPVTVSGVSGATSVAAVQGASCALLATGAVQCWGYPLGLSSINESQLNKTAVAVSGITNAVSLTSGPACGHMCALISDGTVRCWGGNGTGQLGIGTLVNRTTPVTVLQQDGIAPLTGVTSVACGGGYTCAIGQAGQAYCWGGNSFGELGDGTTADSSLPVLVYGF